MKTHGGLKASITVETALVLPIVFGAMFAVLFLVLIMYQNTAQLALMNMNAQYAANYGPGAFTGYAGSSAQLNLPRDKYGFITKKEYLIKNGGDIYNLHYSSGYGDPNVLLSDRILTDTRAGLNVISLFKAEVHSAGMKLGTSIIIRGKLILNKIPFVPLPADAAEINTSGIASYINPSQYIRETDGKCAALAARTTDTSADPALNPPDFVWDSQLDAFLSVYLAELFTEGTFNS
jgi:hypothetical protein